MQYPRYELMLGLLADRDPQARRPGRPLLRPAGRRPVLPGLRRPVRPVRRGPRERLLARRDARRPVARLDAQQYLALEFTVDDRR